jgi:hypothetical protein
MPTTGITAQYRGSRLATMPDGSVRRYYDTRFATDQDVTDWDREVARFRSFVDPCVLFVWGKDTMHGMRLPFIVPRTKEVKRGIAEYSSQVAQEILGSSKVEQLRKTVREVEDLVSTPADCFARTGPDMYFELHVFYVPPDQWNEVEQAAELIRGHPTIPIDFYYRMMGVRFSYSDPSPPGTVWVLERSASI